MSAHSGSKYLRPIQTKGGEVKAVVRRELVGTA